MQFDKPLHDVPDEELYDALARENVHVSYSYADVEGELKRRRTQKKARGPSY